MLLTSGSQWFLVLIGVLWSEVDVSAAVRMAAAMRASRYRLCPALISWVSRFLGMSGAIGWESSDVGLR